MSDTRRRPWVRAFRCPRRVLTVPTDIDVTEGTAEDGSPVWAVASDRPLTPTVLADIRARLPDGAVCAHSETDSDGRVYTLWRVIAEDHDGVA